MSLRLRAFPCLALGSMWLAAACSDSAPATFDDDGSSEGTGANGSSVGGASSGGNGMGGSSSSANGGAGGSGGTGGCSNASECPNDSDCTTATCEADTCGSENVEAGGECNENGGAVCDGAGACVECLDNDQCDEADWCDVTTMLCEPDGAGEDECTDDSQCTSGECFNGSCCGDSPTDDIDADGYTAAEGDCNDCDAAANPGAIDVINTDTNGDPLPDVQQVDEDCSGAPLLPAGDVSCDDDAALLLDTNDALLAAKALDICQMQAGAAWGLVSAEYVQIDGAPLPATAAADIGHGILDGFGTNVLVQRGVKMLALSSGTARLPGAGYVESFDKTYTSAFPAGVPFPSASCPGDTTLTPHDSVALKLVIKAPDNATGLAYDIKFYTSEFPGFICSDFNDLFLAVMSPAPVGAAPAGTGNITFDSLGEPLSVNNALLDVCTAQMAGGKTFDCAAGTDELVGTGFETHGGTSWLTTTAPVTGGDDITLTFGIMDSGDGIIDSSVLVDNFRWAASQGIPVTE